ncbi:hypothetical protein LMG28614_05661 [Paraburkholderia ultramafica]|uniref:KorA protein n=1 Tax=Paraburkholderia ultramafica TaxID=1544867 RepID=A0A6S7BY31_9BURK|nr:KorA protein [Paraburkholderia ultramafica]CAB3802632.1 hypothetical protein LMG28614_05661 [Paraburkholderia ultramafica]
MQNRTVPMGIALSDVDDAFATGKASNVTIEGHGPKSWRVTFTVPDPRTGEPQLFTVLTQRGKIREWADPRNLLEWLADRYAVSEGSFVMLKEGDNRESEEGEP